MERTTFSNAWGRVCQLTPTLRPQVQVHRRLFRGEPWYVLQDPMGNQFARVNPVDYYFIGLLDGRRTVEDAWHQTLTRFGDDAPTQGEVISVLGQLNQHNMLRVDLPADAQPLLERRRRQKTREWGGQAMSILFLRFPLFNPDRLLKWLLPVFQPVLSLPGLILWFAFIATCLVMFLPHLGTFASQSMDLLSIPSNWGWLLAMFIVIKLFHELGHGLVCRRLGGGVYEAGVMMLVLFPCPYMDTTTAWAFDSRYKRLLVSVAGMLFELTFAGIAMLVWLSSQDDLVRQLAQNVILVASIGTLFFNGNPLMRFDGYFMLSDILDIPNLYERATSQLKWLGQRYLYGIKNIAPPSSSRSESLILTIYGIGALLYRVVVMFAIVFLIAGYAFALGLILAIWTVVAWLAIPTGKFIHWLANSSTLHRKRQRALAITLGLAAVTVVLVGIWPMPDHRYVLGVVEAADRAELAIQTEGIVQKIHVHPGQRVEKGQLILTAVNPELESRRQIVEADLRALEVNARDLFNQKPPERMATAARINVLSRELVDINQRLGKLELRSPIAGVVVSPNLTPLEGRFVSAGQAVAQVINPDSLRVTAVVDQSQNSLTLLDQVQSAELRVKGAADRVVPSQLQQTFEAGRMNLPHKSLSTAAGGPIPLDPQAADELKTQRPYFHLWLTLPASDDSSVAFRPGQRVFVRLTLEQRRSLLAQWLHRLRQVFDERVTL